MVDISAYFFNKYVRMYTVLALQFKTFTSSQFAIYTLIDKVVKFCIKETFTSRLYNLKFCITSD